MLVASVAKVSVPVVVVSEAQVERKINIGVRLLKLCPLYTTAAADQ